MLLLHLMHLQIDFGLVLVLLRFFLYHYILHLFLHHLVNNIHCIHFQQMQFLPDIDLLVLISEYFDVDLRDMIDGERKQKKMNEENITLTAEETTPAGEGTQSETQDSELQERPASETVCLRLPDAGSAGRTGWTCRSRRYPR